MDPLLAARNFVGMVIHYLLIHELFGVERASGHSTKKAVETFVSFFLGGIRQIPNLGRINFHDPGVPGPPDGAEHRRQTGPDVVKRSSPLRRM